MKKNKQKRKDWLKGIVSIIFLFIIAGGVLYIYGYLSRPKDEVVNVVQEKDSISKYGYSINDNVTIYYEEEFNKLKSLEDEEEIASQVAKLFVIDLYSMDYKINKYEVTSSQYFYSTKREMHRQKVIDTLYNTMIDNSYDDRKQELPSVTNVDIIETKKDTYSLGDEEVESYVVKLSISYAKDLGYDKSALVTLVKDGENMSVVSYEAL